MPTITTKFEVGQKAYRLTSAERKQITCPTCKGESIVKLTAKYGGKSLQCPNCYGQGKVVDWDTDDIFAVKEIKLFEIRIDIDHSNKCTIKYDLSTTNSGGDYILEKYIFSTEEAAQVACDTSNKVMKEYKALEEIPNHNTLIEDFEKKHRWICRGAGLPAE